MLLDALVVFIVLTLISKMMEKSKAKKTASIQMKGLSGFENVRKIKVDCRDLLEDEIFQMNISTEPSIHNKQVKFFIDSSFAVNPNYKVEWNSAVFMDAAGREVKKPDNVTGMYEDCFDDCMYLIYTMS